MSEGIALIFKFASDNGSSLSGTKTPESFFSATEKLSYFPPKGDSSQCPKRGEGPPKKHPPHRQAKGAANSPPRIKKTPPPSERGATKPPPPKKTSPPRTKGCGNNKFARRREKGKKGGQTSPRRQAKRGDKAPAPESKNIPPPPSERGRQSPRPSKTTPNSPPAAKRKGRQTSRPRKQQKNSSSVRPRGGGIYLPNSVVTGAGLFGTSRLELNVESNFRCDQVGRSLQVLFIRSALRPCPPYPRSSSPHGE